MNKRRQGKLYPMAGYDGKRHKIVPERSGHRGRSLSKIRKLVKRRIKRIAREEAS